MINRVAVALALVSLASAATACSHHHAPDRCAEAQTAEAKYYASASAAEAHYQIAVGAARKSDAVVYDQNMRLSGQIIVDEPTCFAVEDLANAKQYLSRPTVQP